ncbi:MAG: hypothetical protein BWZ02_02260 [Lentisphaerae bacterium ADurb.BinA184]|nr:MAG: hypothetical protein BWZ02_02260 [Lentisphaerae bacterium ADurb.BinA184]
MPANPDYSDLFSIFNAERVEYLVAGAHAVIFYAEPRYTKDLDVWVNPTPENARRVWRALARFGAPLSGVTEADFTDGTLVYQIGVEPNRIDILMGLEPLRFESAWAARTTTAYDGVPIGVLSRDDLIRCKRAAGRPQDLLDIQRLELDDGATP